MLGGIRLWSGIRFVLAEEMEMKCTKRESSWRKVGVCVKSFYLLSGVREGIWALRSMLYAL